MVKAVFVVVLVVAGLAGAPASRAAAPASPREFVARDLHLSPGQPFFVSLHPGVEPVEVRATPADVEVCQATMNGGARGVEGKSWPSYAHFDGCRTPDASGVIRLPSIVVPTWHVAFLVRGRSDAPVALRRLRITYVPGDGFFAFSAPPFTRVRSGVSFSVTPRVDRSIGVLPRYDARFTEMVRARVALTQEGTRIPVAGEGVERGEARYGPVRLGVPVAARVGAPPGADGRVTWFLRWE